MEGEKDQGAVEHVSFIRSLLSVFVKGINYVVELFGDNRNVKKSIFKKLNRPRIGSDSHQFNLEVNYSLSHHNGLIEEVNALMVNLHTPLISGKCAQGHT